MVIAKSEAEDSHKAYVRNWSLMSRQIMEKKMRPVARLAPLRADEQKGQTVWRMRSAHPPASEGFAGLSWQ